MVLIKPSSWPVLENLYTQIGDSTGDWRNQNLNQLIINASRGKTLLDIGCGVGHLLALAQKEGYEVLGIEPNRQLIQAAFKLYPKLRHKIECLSAENLSRLKGKFDTVTIIDVIEHIHDDLSVLKKIRSVLKKDGRLTLVTSAYPWLFSRRDKSLGHYRRYSKSGLIAKLKRAGFAVNSVRYWDWLGFLPYLFIVKIFRRNFFLVKLRKRPQISSLCLDLWFKYVENRVNFGMGLSLIVYAEKNKN